MGAKSNSQYMKAYEEEVARTEAARERLPPVETMLGLDELQVAFRQSIYS